MDIIEKIEKRKLKGYLTVKHRIVFKQAHYHLTQRAPGKELLFLEDGDYLYFLKILKETVAKFQLDLFCFALLPNHLHLLLRINQKNLSAAMKNLFERYAFYFNKKYQRKGHVFSGRYRASLCYDDVYLLAVSCYIHLNPYRANLCEDIQGYRWTSLDLYTSTDDKKSFISPEAILRLLDTDKTKAKKEYFRILKESSKVDGTTRLDSPSLKVYLKKILKVTDSFIKGESQDLEKMIQDFKSKKKVTRPEEKKARKYLIEQLAANGYSMGEICKTLSISKMTCYRILGKKLPNDTKQV